MTAELTDPDGDPTRVVWQWALAASPTGSYTNVSSGVDQASYTPVAADVRKYLRAWASYADPSRRQQEREWQYRTTRFRQRRRGTTRRPVFSERHRRPVGVGEHAATETSFGTPVTASDANSDTLTYTLGGADADSFGIVAASGQLRTKDPLDYESRSSYQVTVTAADPSNASDIIDVTITVSNVDEYGTVKLVNGPTPGGDCPDRHTNRPRRRSFQRRLAVGEKHYGFRPLYQRQQRGGSGRLHAGSRRLGPLPPGDGDLYRPARLGQERAV